MRGVSTKRVDGVLHVEWDQDAQPARRRAPKASDAYAAGGTQSAAPTAASKPVSLPAVDKRLIAAVNDLGFKLYQHASKAGESYFVSATSIAYALAMVTNGAEGKQVETMLETLGLGGMEMKAVNAGFKALTSALLAKQHGVESKLANGIWAAKDVKPSKDFVDAVTKDFGAAIKVGDMKQAYKAINAFVDETTNGFIKDPIKPGLLDDAIMALVNCIYFKGDWTVAFDEKATRELPFTKTDGTEVDVPMMRKAKTTAEAKSGEDFQAVRLPYGKDKSASLVVIVPQGDHTPAQVMASLATAAGKAKYLTGYACASGSVALPRFEVSFDQNVKPALEKMGVPLSGAFTGIDPQATVGVVQHVAKVKVNEKGTEAAAVTVVGVTRSSVSRPEVLLYADRPFVFLIVHEASQAVTFTGTYEGPKG